MSATVGRMRSLPELGQLRAELRAAGVFEHCEAQSWIKLALLGAGMAACLVAIVTLGFWAALVAVPVAGVLGTSIAMLGHEGSHRSFSASPLRNQLLVYLVSPLFAGLSSLYWRHKHDRLHHGHPNVEGLDPDIKPWPFVSSRGDHERCSRGLRWFQRSFQSWAFWPMSLLMSIGMRRASLIYVAQFPARHGVTRAWLIEVACLLAHYTAWIVIPSLVWGPWIGIGVYTAIWGVAGVCLALVFVPAHIGLPIVTEQHHDWLHQVETTQDLELPRVVSFFFIGLDYQVEHHLFPRIPHQHLPRAAEVTARWCREHQLPYRSLPYLRALGDAAASIRYAWDRDASDPIAVRAGLYG
jgi:fatty acid desaturase